MPAPLLHLVTTAQWREFLTAGAIAPPSLAEVGFVHLSGPEQVALPADRLLAGRDDVWLLVLDPERIGVEVRYEPGVPGDPESMRFPHAYGPVPLTAVTSVLPYRPRPDGRFDPPAVPVQDAAGRTAAMESSLVRRAASTEVPVTGGVAVLLDAAPDSWVHNQLLVDTPTDPAQLVAEADRVLGGAGREHRRVLLLGDRLAGTAQGLADLGWQLDEVVGMAVSLTGPTAPTGPDAAPVAEPVAGPPAVEVDRAALVGHTTRRWREEMPAMTDHEIGQMSDRWAHDGSDLRHLAVLVDGEPVASCILRLDGGTAQLDAVYTEIPHRRAGHADRLLHTARARATAAGCDLVVLTALVGDHPLTWYTRRGFTPHSRSWEAMAPTGG